MEPFQTTDPVVPSDLIIKKIIHYRFSSVQTNPIRKWRIGDKTYEFKRGTNNTKGLHMSRLGALVRHIFYDRKTQIIYATEGPLSRRTSLIDDPDFIDIMRFEYRNSILFAPWIPHSLEYIAKIYKYLIQNVIEPELEVDAFQNIMANMVASTFGQLTTSGMEKEVRSLEEKQDLTERRNREYRKFGQRMHDLAEELRKHKPSRGEVVLDLSDYSVERNYDDASKRGEALKEILGTV